MLTVKVTCQQILTMVQLPGLIAFFFFPAVGSEPRPSVVLGKCYAMDPDPPSYMCFYTYVG